MSALFTLSSSVYPTYLFFFFFFFFFFFLFLLLPTLFLYSFPSLCLPEIPGEILLSHVYWIWHGHHVWRFKESTKEGRLFFLFLFLFLSFLFYFIFFSLSCLDPIDVWLQFMLYTMFLSHEGKQTKFTIIVAYLDGLLLLQDGGAFPDCFVLFFTPPGGNGLTREGNHFNESEKRKLRGSATQEHKRPP
ncbi:hypothetical protein BDV36DRAFT_305057 [Aspergillus pseudocaelatus]|uniref:Uncharacterized protein n=1 Tax=Aspergillus pseudocaelatus TaxID=1825620 RepID=A0ABQ6W4Y3_9EURO|nr:hypothetical protein BDV36DRAFT_305057 [Aspergillus pseudocaelatus]